ncbi:MAG: alpha/beta fold hydrolase [Cyanobacteria bacterium Co-bin13]|nr:alpha/beta fold hydrolase [Cyanobacteria bacterium Co-bin13]
MTRYIYLHGFASGPQSMKAQTLQLHFQTLGLTLAVPDLNQGDFAHLTLSRQIQQVKALISPNRPTVLIGSSFGGLTAAWLAEQPELRGQIERLVLMAPAFRFLEQWLPRLGDDQHQRWQRQGTLPVYHYGEQRQIPLHYSFITDAQTYDEHLLHQPIPTLILHGRQDEVISIQASRDYAAQRPWVKLIELESDHALGNVQTEIWQAIQQFLEL